MTARADVVTVTDVKVYRDSQARRAVDILVAVLGLVLTSPVLGVLALWVRATSDGSAIFRQERVGRDGRPFVIWKLRTMTLEMTPAAPLISGRDDPRITRAGHSLRASRLDELPQLVNMLRGDLTLIGSRPEVARFVPYYTAEERRIFEVRPGVLGPGALLFVEEQARGLDTAADPEAYYVNHVLHPKLAADLAYLDNRRLSHDLMLLLRTARALCARGRRSA